MKASLFTTAILATVSLGAHAEGGFNLFRDPPGKGARAARAAAKQAERDIKAGRLQAVSEKALEALVKTSFDVLRFRGQYDYAARMERDFARRFGATPNSGLGTLDLGDHEPLNAWLAGFYDGMEKRIGAKWLHFFRIDDIKIFNYGIPVSIHPEGNPKDGSEWGSLEYKLHFVPTAGAATYWVANLGCSAVVPLPAGLGCGIAALVPRYGMERFVAPKLSDEIYVRANR